MPRIAPRRQAQIPIEKRRKFKELFPSLVEKLGISDDELYSFLNEEFDIPLVNFTRGREKSEEIPMQSKDEAYDIMKTDDFREKLEDRFSALGEPPAEEPPAEEPRVAAKKVARTAARTAARVAKKVAKKVARTARVPDAPVEPEIRKKDKRFLDTMDERAAEEVLEEPEVDYTDKAVEIFKDLHGTEFDPKSRMDGGKLEKMKSMLADVGGIGDDKAAVNKFALQFYRNS